MLDPYSSAVRWAAQPDRSAMATVISALRIMVVGASQAVRLFVVPPRANAGEDAQDHADERDDGAKHGGAATGFSGRHHDDPGQDGYHAERLLGLVGLGQSGWQ